MGGTARRYCTSLAVSLLLWAWAVMPLHAQETATCPAVPASAGGHVAPSPCVPFGSPFALHLRQYTPGQLRSLVLAGPGGLVSGADRALRVDHLGRLVLDSTSYFGTALGSGPYTAWVKDPAGIYTPAELHFRVIGGDHIPMPTPTLVPTPTTAPTATLAPTPTTSPSALPTMGTPTPTVETPTPQPTAATPTVETTTPLRTDASTTPASERVQIVLVEPDLPEDEGLVEYLLLENTTSAPIALSGWILSDADGNRSMLPTFTLEAEEQVVVWTGSGVNDAVNLYLGRSTSIWDSDSDTAVLLNDQGGEEARYTY